GGVNIITVRSDPSNARPAPVCNAGAALAPSTHSMLSTPVADIVEHVERGLDECMAADRHRLAEALARLRAAETDSERFATRLATLRASMAQSQARRLERLARIPVPSYPESLPVAARRDEIAT